MTPLKDIYYNRGFYQNLAERVAVVYPKFNTRQFVDEALVQLPTLELKQRIALTSQLCRKYLPDNYKKALKIFYALSESLTENFSYIFMPDFVARYGMGHFDMSMLALKDFTEYSSSELALRSFLKADLDRTMSYVYQWAEDDNYHVRRLACEGTRPRLPWAVRVPQLNQNPSITLPILRTLCTDREKYVQKSVANHLNDISRDHPEVMLDTVAAWDATHTATGWIVKHAARTLIKKGHPRALALFGAEQKPQVRLSKFRLLESSVDLGEHLEFSVALLSQAEEEQRLIVDYKIHFVKKSGELKPKVFKLKTLQLQPNETVTLTKKHLFKDFTTRKHYAGEHAVEIVVNGEPMLKQNFQLHV
ncbi:DNA alkylation repair protein [Kaarinaea lacus]